jgi:hypothetical protein
MTLMVAIITAEPTDSASGLAYQLINARTSKNQFQFLSMTIRPSTMDRRLVRSARP